MFDNIKPIDPRKERRKKQIWIAIGVFVLVAPILYYEFKNWTEERAVQHFLAALEQENYQGAYQIWGPGPSYHYQDFLRDWGKSSEYGKVQSFAISSSHAMGSGVVVTARINQKEARIWVEKSDKRLSFPPF
jgi:hypothetical protein